MAKLSSDFSEWNKILDRLSGPARESLARRMAVSGGVVLRDEAKALAPVGKSEEQATAPYGGSIAPGSLRNAIYLAFNERLSTTQSYTYTVSWNGSLAPHGHLIEFGHWMPYQVIFSPEIGWRTTKKLLPSPKWVSAKPFLRPAYDAGLQRAYAAMIQRGRTELPKLLRGEK